MKGIQYTIRNIPPEVDRTLRARARKTGKSFNQVIVDTLHADVKKKNSFQAFYEAADKVDWSEFEESQKWLETLPRDVDL